MVAEVVSSVEHSREDGRGSSAHILDIGGRTPLLSGCEVCCRYRGAPMAADAVSKKGMNVGKLYTGVAKGPCGPAESFHQESHLTFCGALQGTEEALPMVAEVVSKEAMEISREAMEASKEAGMATQVGATGDSQVVDMAMQVAAMAGEASRAELAQHRHTSPPKQ